MRKFILTIVGLAVFFTSVLPQSQTQGQTQGQPQGQQQNRQPRPLDTVPRRNPGVHDPVMIKDGNMYYCFCTGNGISMFSSPDMIMWKQEKQVFATAPEWIAKELPRFGNGMWAPDISFYKGNYYLLYACSSMGSNNSCIGIAMNKTLHTNSPDYKWVDLGMVVRSVSGRDHWNAIDPNLIVDDAGTPWLDFGSFWDGMKLVKLKDDLTGIARPEEWYTIARRFRDPFTADRSAGAAQIEAPFIFKHGPFYYLFVSWDKCCSGLKSTYKVAYGRATKVTGPYLAKDSVDMAKGGGTIIAQGDTNYVAVGHQGVISFDGKDFLLYHGYDAHDNGRSKLIIRKLIWDAQGWATLGEL